MASRSFSVSNSNGRFTLTLTLTEGTQSVANNQTPLSYSLVLKANTGYNFELYKIGRTVTLNGTTVYNVAREDSASLSIADYGSLILVPETTTNITHDNDGTKSISVAFSINMASASYTPGAMSGSGTMTLTTIPRATQPTLSPSSVTLGNNMTINLPRAASTFTHNTYYSFNGGQNVLIQQGATTSSTWAVPLSLANQIPNATSGTGTIICSTYNNGSKVGDKTAPFTAIVPDNANTKPTCSFTIAASGNPTWVTSGYVQGKTSVTATITGTPKYSSPISTYKLTVNGVATTKASSPVTSGVISNSGSISVKGAVINSRGFSSDESLTAKTINVIPYAKPSIIKHPSYNSIVCARCDANGNLTDSGKYLLVRMRCRWSSLANKENTASVTYSVVSKDGTVNKSDTITSTVLGGGSSNNYYSWYDLNEKLNLDLATTKAFTATIKITDRYGEYGALTFPIPTEDVAFHLGQNGDRAAFGKYAEHAKTVEIADDWTLMASGNVQGRVLGLGALPEITANKDLNDCLTIGVYSVRSNAIAQSLKNCPTANAGTLRIYSGTGGGLQGDAPYVYLIQEFVTHTAGATFRRRIYTGTEIENGKYKYYYDGWLSYVAETNTTVAITADSNRLASSWKVRYCATGLVELQARVTFTNVAIVDTWGTCFSHYLEKSSLTYPVTFKELPICQVTIETTTGGDAWVTGCDKVAPSTTKTPMYQVVRPNSRTSETIVLDYFVRGFI